MVIYVILIWDLANNNGGLMGFEQRVFVGYDGKSMKISYYYSIYKFGGSVRRETHRTQWVS